MADSGSVIDIMNYLNDPFATFSTDEELDETVGALDESQRRMHQETQSRAANEGGEQRKRKADNGPETFSGSASKRRKEIKLPRALTDLLRLYKTSRYALYDEQLRNKGSPVNQSFKCFCQYDEYTLYCNPNLTLISEIPTEGVRLDDMTAASVLMKCDRSVLHSNWPAEFNYNGTIYATRAPLGFAAKFWRNEGDVDIDGHTLTKAEEGYYYKWWRNIHCLCGKEGVEADMYQIRPSFTKAGPIGFGFKVSSRAVIQLPSGDRNDPNFSACTLPSAAGP